MIKLNSLLVVAWLGCLSIALEANAASGESQEPFPQRLPAQSTNNAPWPQAFGEASTPPSAYPAASSFPTASTAPAQDPPAIASAPQKTAGSATQGSDATRLFESTWYTRVDYFSWQERLNAAPFMREQGVLPTIGYMRRSGHERFRVELFGSKVDYSADIQFDDGVLKDLSKTDYLGMRGEYELMVEPQRWPSVSLFGGLGSRFWIRNLPDNEIDANHIVLGYQEDWWTFYPYLGMETRRTMSEDYEFYWRGRIGLIAFTYQHISKIDATLYPRQGLTAQLEAGIRGPHLFLSANFEAMQWSQSAMVVEHSPDGNSPDIVAFQPRSQMYLVGLKTGFSF
jgi:hypothetical protein